MLGLGQWVCTMGLAEAGSFTVGWGKQCAALGKQEPGYF